MTKPYTRRLSNGTYYTPKTPTRTGTSATMTPADGSLRGYKPAIIPNDDGVLETSFDFETAGDVVDAAGGLAKATVGIVGAVQNKGLRVDAELSSLDEIKRAEGESDKDYAMAKQQLKLDRDKMNEEIRQIDEQFGFEKLQWEFEDAMKTAQLQTEAFDRFSSFAKRDQNASDFMSQMLREQRSK